MPRGVKPADLAAEEQAIIKQLKDQGLNKTPAANMQGLIQKLARNYTAQGVRDADVLVDKVHDAIKTAMPSISRSEVMNSISGYGDYRVLSKDEISSELRRMKGELQQLGKIEDLQKGQPPLKTGVERRVPSKLEEARIKEVNRIKRQLGIGLAEPAAKLKAVKTRMQNRIAELQDKMARGDYTKTARKPVALDEEGMKLKSD